MGAKSSRNTPSSTAAATVATQQAQHTAVNAETSNPHPKSSAQDWRDFLLENIEKKSANLSLSNLTLEDVNNIPWELLPQCQSVRHLDIDNFPVSGNSRHDKDTVEQLFPSQIYEMTNLQTLTMSGYPFEYLSPRIGNLVHLEKLNFTGSSVICLPPEIGRLTKLSDLSHYCSHAIAYAPYELIKCPITKTYISRRPNYIYNGELLPPLPKPQAQADIMRDIERLWVDKCGMVAGLMDVILDYLPCRQCSNPQCENSMVWQECIHYAWGVYKPGADPVCLLATMCSSACVESVGYGKRYYLALMEKSSVPKDDVADAKFYKNKANDKVYVNVRVDAMDKQVVCKSLGWSGGIRMANDLKLKAESENFQFFWKYKLGIKYASYEIVQGLQNETQVTFTA